MADKKVLHSLIDEMADAQAHKIAISSPTEDISYATLKERSDSIASYLLQLRFSRSEVAGIYLGKSIGYIVSLLGVNKAGGIFMPLDPAYPVLRMEKLLKKAGVRWFVTNNTQEESLLSMLLSTGLATNKVHVIVINEEQRPVKQVIVENSRIIVSEPVNNILVSSSDIQPSGGDSNYLLYTSGSTGEPKLIEGCHKSLSHFIHWEVEEFKLDKSVNVSHLAATTFDVSLRDIFVPLLAGGKLSIPPEDLLASARALWNWIVAEKVSLIHTVPSIFRSFIQELKQGTVDPSQISHLKYILIAGEALYVKDVQEWRTWIGDSVLLVNLYGPSETTLAKIFNRIQDVQDEPHEIIPLGTPLPGTKVLILSENLLCGTGAVGEICIKTPFRSKGYYNDPELTKATFVQNPIHANFEDIIYRTGDLGRYQKDGTIQFVGRNDRQVKIRGNRVEMNEVEAVIKKMPGIEQVLVKPVQQKNMEFILIGYYKENTPVSANEIIFFLQQQLPPAFIPSYFVKLDIFPLNLNGKIDSKALPLPEELLYQDEDFVAPETFIERQVASIWAGILGHNKLSTTRSFFVQGGHSLSATRIISQIYREIGKEMSIREFFNHPTIKEQARLLEIKHRQEYHIITKVTPAEFYPLSYIQRNIWIYHQKEGAQSLYNMPVSCVISGNIDFQALNNAFKSVIHRHESLRTGFSMVDGVPMQKIHEQVDFSLILKLENTNLAGTADIDRCQQQELDLPFDLEKPPLIRGQVIKLEEKRYLLLLTVHHIVCDGWSIGLLIDEVLTFYTAYWQNVTADILPLPLQYKDYAHWFNRMADDKMNIHRKYWQQQLNGDITPLALPLDRGFEQRRTYEGKVIPVTLSAELSDNLRTMADKTGTSLFIIVLSAINMLLYKYSGQSSLYVGAPIAGRVDQNLEGLIGVFLNYLVLKTDIDRDVTYLQFIEQVRTNALSAFDHQVYPYGLLVEEFYPDGSTNNRNPFYDVLIVMNNSELNGTAQRQTDLEEILGAEKISLDSNTSKVAITFFVTDAEKIHINVEYSTELFEYHTMEMMLTKLQQLFTLIPLHGETTLKDLNTIISDEGEQRSAIELSAANLNFITEEF
jgi:amino acid adenylation domain-containing protein